MAHIHDKIDFCSEVFIVFNNKVLLRKHDKYKIWLGVGGHIELHEDPSEAAVREVKEEVGLDVVLFKEAGKQPQFNDSKNISLIPPQYLNRHPISENHEHIAFIYFGASETDQLKLSETEIAEECRWFAKEELIKGEYGISEMVKFYAGQALEKLYEKQV